jgi:hypothetical protein
LEVALLEKSQQNSSAILGSQIVNGFVKDSGNFTEIFLGAIVY